ncbi:SusC/RagA family TonB-linked outer membrane protein [Dinghuibacter silviterrae]|uniref:TonB-linked SusC/RagA family outer membrane protein n=1 Tax=Dinghuibacter silviterrae TaxID=1539049 RepID=A0A4R8DEM3_9BACT|nr:SusC/RagA family TonB-linked outer membrane protein [Dinghuibacter silviterrae]TDW95885.1 TonB-linked SusC/RagA family outer membrane protein [Dinghuibacter silviterrae]
MITFFKLLLRLHLLTAFFLLLVGPSYGQEAPAGRITVKGSVVDAGGPLDGASISEKGAQGGTTSDKNGNFSLSVSGRNAVLVVSYVGYNNTELALNGKNFVKVTLQPTNGNTMSGVVVTALGITRSKRSLGYDVGQVSGEDLNHVPQNNWEESMAGRVSGVAIASTSSAPTASVSVVIRGIRSLNSDNQPLFVVDGVPLQNSMNNVGVNNGSGNDADYGNVISDINPNDIESVSILKGPSAAALYGSRAGNGVVLITTKSGKKARGLGMSFSSNEELAAPYKVFPTIQDYSMGTDPYTVANGYNSWKGVIVDVPSWDTYYFGTPLNQGINAIQWNSPLQSDGTYKPLPLVSHPNLKNFVQDGLTATNTVSVENATDKDNYRFSFTNLVNQDIIPTGGMNRNNLSLNVEHKMSPGVKLSSSINYARSASNNVLGGNENSALTDVITLPASIDVRQIKNYWLTPGIQQMKPLPPVGVDQSPAPETAYGNNVNDNPWFVVNQVKNGYVRNHLLGNVKASVDFSSHVSAFLRYSQDLFYDNRETKISKSYDSELNGYYGLDNIFNSESNTDFLVTYKKRFLTKLDISASAGGNLLYQYNSNNQVYSAPGTGIIAPELFNVSNIAQANIRYNSAYYKKAVYSAYATASLGYDDMAYLDLTGRNDWSSTLPPGSNSYFYPSASLSLLLNRIFHMAPCISLAKARFGWASVGKDTDPYNLYGVVGIGSFGGTTTESLSTTLLNPNLKPELAVSSEGGIDLALFKSRLRFSGTVYRSDNKNQILGISTPPSSGYGGRQINAGLVRSQGIELSLGGTIISNKNWNWDVNFNWTKNNAYIISLANGVPYFSFWQDGPTGSWTYAKGQPIPNQYDSKGHQVISDGKIGQLWDNQIATVTDPTSAYYGYPLLNSSGTPQKLNGGDFQHKVVAGNFNPKLLLGFQTSVRYKRFTLSANIDSRFGGIFYSKTYRYQGSNANLRQQENMGIPIPSAYANNIPAYLKTNPGKYILPSGFTQVHMVGGPTKAQGGLYNDPSGPNSTAIPGYPIYDAAFYPGVRSDGSGGYIENLGDPNTTVYDDYEDATTNGYWSFARMDMFSASYIKLRDLTLSTQLPASWSNALRLQGISFGVYTRNLILWTKAKINVDPEQAFDLSQSPQGNGSQFKQGIEYYNIRPWTIPVGVKLNVRF